MRVVLTGGLGFVGQNLAIHLRKTHPGVHLTAVDWFDAPRADETALFDTVHKACFSSDSAKDLFRDADVVVHLAARTTVQESIDDPMATFEQNVVKTQHLLEFLRLNAPGAKFIFASTGGAIIGDYDGAIDEEVCARPLSPYGASKLAVEGLLSAYRGSYGLSSASMRFSNVYGPNSLRKGSVVATFCKMYMKDGTLQVNGDGQQTRDYIYIADIADAIARVIDQDAQGVFQLGTGTGTSILDLVDVFKRVRTDVPPTVAFAPALNGEVRHNRANIAKIRNQLGFAPAWSLEDGVKATLDWFETEKASGGL